MDPHYFAFFTLASAQVLLYRISVKPAFKNFVFLWVFYFSIFTFAEGLNVFCRLFSISFYEIPLFVLAILILFGRKLKGLPKFQKSFRSAPDFYLLSGLWIGLASIDIPAQGRLYQFLFGFFYSYVAAFLLPIMAALKEKLALTNPPEEFSGLPIFLVTAGLVSLALFPFLK